MAPRTSKTTSESSSSPSAHHFASSSAQGTSSAALTQRPGVVLPIALSMQHTRSPARSCAELAWIARVTAPRRRVQRHVVRAPLRLRYVAGGGPASAPSVSRPDRRQTRSGVPARWRRFFVWPSAGAWPGRPHRCRLRRPRRPFASLRDRVTARTSSWSSRVRSGHDVRRRRPWLCAWVRAYVRAGWFSGVWAFATWLSAGGGRWSPGRRVLNLLSAVLGALL